MVGKINFENGSFGGAHGKKKSHLMGKKRKVENLNRTVL